MQLLKNGDISYDFLNYFITLDHALLLYYLNPSLWSFDTAHLNACKCLIKLLGYRTHLCHSAWEADLLAVVNNLANR